MRQRTEAVAPGEQEEAVSRSSEKEEPGSFSKKVFRSHSDLTSHWAGLVDVVGTAEKPGLGPMEVRGV